MAEADAVRERYVYSAPWFMAYCLFFWPVYVVFLFAFSGGMFAAALFGTMVCIAHVILARQGVLRHRSRQLISFGEFGVTLGDGTVVPAESIVCCYGVCRFHQEIIDAGDIHIVTNQGQLCLINDVVGISAFLSFNYFQYRSLWAGVAVGAGPLMAKQIASSNV